MPVQTQMQVRRGTASSWTSTNPTLAAGELGFETNTGKFKIGNGSSTWTSLLYAGGGQSSLTTYQYTATAGQTTFSGADINSNTLAYTVGAIQVYLNGALLQNTVDFTASTGTSVVLTGGAGLGDSLTIISFATFDVANTIPVSAFTAKGQILVATGSGAYSAQAVGANGTILTADSAEADGVKWAAPATGSSPSYNLLNAGGTALTGAATITVSGISNQKAILVLIEGASSTSASQTLGVRFNGDTGLNYSCFGSGVITGSTYNKDNFGVKMQGYSGRSLVQLVYTGNNAAAQVSGSVHLFNADSTGWKAFSAVGATDTDGAAVNGESYTSQGFYEASGSITSVSVFVGGGTFDNGTVYVLGAS